MADRDAVVAAASTLGVRPRGRRWAHLSLCVLDAVFSIGARYESTIRTCERYAEHARLPPLVESSSAGSVIGTDLEQPLSAFVADVVGAVDVASFARDVLGNRQRTSPRGGVLKAEAALRYAQILVDAGVERYHDVEGLFDHEPRMATVTAALRAVPGEGASGIRSGYLFMLLGDDEVIQPDRMVLRWLEAVLGRHPTVQEARGLVGGAAAELGCTPWELDHAIWQAQRSRRPVVASDTVVTRRYRALQGRWREEVLGLPAGAPTSRVTTVSTVDSMLPAVHDGVRAEDAGWNLMSAAAVEYARARVPVIRAAHGVVETDRLWRNTLSSQPLAFSIVGELRAHPEPALAVLSELSGCGLAGFDRIDASGGPYVLDGLQAEWAPPREAHLGDRSGFDIAAALRAADGTRTLITVEVKYTDTFSPRKLDLDRYEHAVRRLGLDTAAARRLVDLGASQFLRSVLLTDSVRRGGRSGSDPVDEVLAVVLSRDDDHIAESVVSEVARAQTAVPVARWGLGRFLDVAADQAELADWADTVRARYLFDEPAD